MFTQRKVRMRNSERKGKTKLYISNSSKKGDQFSNHLRYAMNKIENTCTGLGISFYTLVRVQPTYTDAIFFDVSERNLMGLRSSLLL